MSNNYYVQVDMTGFKSFYYNMEAAINKAVLQEIGEKLSYRPLTAKAREQIQKYGELGANLPKTGRSGFGVMSAMNTISGQMEFISAHDMSGITAIVNQEIGMEVLERAKYYCPVDTGRLINSGRLEMLSDNTCRIYFDCQYAWYVHEFTWKNHQYPTCAKFLTRAMYEVMKEHGYAV